MSCGSSIHLTLISRGRDRHERRRVVAGADDLNFIYRAQYRYLVEQIVHPAYESSMSLNDIALIKVNKPFEMTSTLSHVAPICLERGIAIPTYDIVTVSGFGAPAFGEDSNLRLYSADVAVIDPQTCNRSFDYTISPSMVCAGGMVRNGRDACTVSSSTYEDREIAN